MSRPSHLPRLPQLVVPFLIAVAPAFAEPAASPTGTAAAATTAPAFSLPAMLRDHALDGKVVLVQVGMVGCELSGKGLDEMIRISKDKAIDGLSFIRVECGRDADARKEHFTLKKPPFGVIVDGDHSIFRGLDASAFPTYLLIDKFGAIRYRGPWPDKQLVPWTAELVAQTKAAAAPAPMFGAAELDVPKLMESTRLPEIKADAKAAKPLGEYAGEKGVLLLFVDTKCPFSAAALKEMPGVALALSAQKVKSVVVNSDDAKEAVEAFYAKNDPGAPVVFDATAATRKAWNVTAVPVAVYITPDKKIGYAGKATWKDLGAAIEKSLGLTAGTIKFGASGTGYG